MQKLLIAIWMIFTFTSFLVTLQTVFSFM
jgi:hypothetical protein